MAAPGSPLGAAGAAVGVATGRGRLPAPPPTACEAAWPPAHPRGPRGRDWPPARSRSRQLHAARTRGPDSQAGPSSAPWAAVSWSPGRPARPRPRQRPPPRAPRAPGRGKGRGGPTADTRARGHPTTTGASRSKSRPAGDTLLIGGGRWAPPGDCGTLCALGPGHGVPGPEALPPPDPRTPLLPDRTAPTPALATRGPAHSTGHPDPQGKRCFKCRGHFHHAFPLTCVFSSVILKEGTQTQSERRVLSAPDTTRKPVFHPVLPVSAGGICAKCRRPRRCRPREPGPSPGSRGAGAQERRGAPRKPEPGGVPQLEPGGAGSRPPGVSGDPVGTPGRGRASGFSVAWRLSARGENCSVKISICDFSISNYRVQPK